MDGDMGRKMKESNKTQMPSFDFRPKFLVFIGQPPKECPYKPP
jgi:hypothetical protein